MRRKETIAELVALLEETIALQAELNGKALKFTPRLGSTSSTVSRPHRSYISCSSFCGNAEIRNARRLEKEDLEKLQRLVVLLLTFSVISVFLMAFTLLRERS